MKIYKILRYFSHMLEGPDHLLSGKRVIGTTLAVTAIFLAVYGLKHFIEHLDSVTGLVTSLLTASAVYWGITAWATKQAQDLNNSTNITTTDDDSTKQTTIDKTTTTPENKEQ